jgi:hypothetical protein
MGVAFAMAVSLVLVAGCQSGGSGTSSSSVAQTIGPAGGTATVSSGPIAGAAIVVPAGALSSDVVITIAPGSDVASTVVQVQGAGPAVSFGPSGQTFSADVTLTIPFDPQSLPAGFLVGDIIVLVLEDGASTVTQLSPTSVDLINNLVTFTLSGFTTCQAALVVRDTAAGTTISVTITADTISEEGQATDAVVTRSGDLSRSAVVQLTSSPTGVLTIPPQVTIMPGQDSAQFVVQGVNNKLLDGTRSALLTATLAGVTPSALSVSTCNGSRL